MSIPHATLQDLLDQCGRLAQQARRLHPERLQIAAFDADGTLWGPDVADLLWSRLAASKALHRAGGASLARAVRACGGEPTRDPYLDFVGLQELHKGGQCPEERMTRAMLQGLAGMTESEVYAHAEEAVSAAPELTAERIAPVAAMMQELRAFGYRTVVVSGSPRWAVEVAVRPLGLGRLDVLAGEVAVVEGLLTDGVLDPLPHGPGKVQAILRRFGAVPRVSLGNAVADLAMLEATSHLRVLVNPSRELIEACETARGATWAMSLLGAPLAAAPAGRQRREGRAATGRRARIRADA